MNVLHLSRGNMAIVDAEDFEWLSQWKWSYATVGYAVRRKSVLEDRSSGEMVYMHRIILDCPATKEIDHINRNKLDNRRCNLRIASRRLNAANVGAHRDNTTGVVGVQMHMGGYMARIRINNKTVYLGWSKDLAGAIALRNNAEAERMALYLAQPNA